MSNTQIRGNIDIVASTITNTEISASAAIATSKLADAANFILRTGTVAFTADQSMGGFKLTNVATPVSGTDAVNKDYADAIAAGLTPNAATKVSTTATLTLTTDYTRAGTGATHVLTATANGALSLDGVSTFTDIDNDGASANPFAATPASRVLVRHASDAKDNGIYAVKDKGSGGTPWKLIRATDFDGAPTNEVTGGDFVWVQAGTLYNGSQWTVVATGTVTVDTDDINWTQTNGTGSITASTGLVKVGNDVRLNITDLSADTIVAADEIAFYDASGADVNKVTFANFEGALALNNISGTLGVAKGGTGATTFTSNGVLYGNGTSAIQATSASTAAGAILHTASSGGAPSFTSSVLLNDTTRTLFTASGTLTVDGFSTTTVKTTDQTAGSTNSAITSITTGSVSGATSNSGQLSLTTGTSTTSGNTGPILIRSGVPTSGTSGSVTLQSGNSTAGLSGDTLIATGTGTSNTGAITIQTGTAAASNSGEIQIRSGITTTSGTTGDVSVTTGGSAGASGALTLGTGNASSGNSGAITISTGTATGTAGTIIMQVAGTTEATIASTGLNLASGNVYQINAQTVVSNATLDGGLMIGSSGGGYTHAQLTQGTGISITNGGGTITIATTGVITSASIVTEEVPSGTINGVNDTFTLANTPIAGTVRVYLRGLRRKSGGGNDYTISGTTLTMITIPQTGDAFFVDYFK